MRLFSIIDVVVASDWLRNAPMETWELSGDVHEYLPYKVNVGVIKKFKQATFLSHGRQLQVSDFPTYLSSQCHIYLVQYLFNNRDDWFENLGETTVLSCERLLSGFRSWLKSVASLNCL